MFVVLMICAGLLIASLLLSLYRLGVGPSTMDRAAAVDVITAGAIGLVIVTMALTGRPHLLPVLAVLALVGFVGSTTIARFAHRDSDAEARLLSEEEVRVLLAAEEARRDDDEPVHDEGEGA